MSFAGRISRLECSNVNKMVAASAKKEKYVHSLRMMTKTGHPALAVRVQHSAALE
jgi:hypothetical protein